MVLLTMTPAIVQAIEQLGNFDRDPEICNDPPLDGAAVGKPISHLQVIAISKQLKQLRTEGIFPKDVVPCHLDELLRGSQVYFEPPKPKAEPVEHLSNLATTSAERI